MKKIFLGLFILFNFAAMSSCLDYTRPGKDITFDLLDIEDELSSILKGIETHGNIRWDRIMPNVSSRAPLAVLINIPHENETSQKMVQTLIGIYMSQGEVQSYSMNPKKLGVNIRENNYCILFKANKRHRKNIFFQKILKKRNIKTNLIDARRCFN